MPKKIKSENKHLVHGICHLNMIPVRVKPTDDAIVSSQMLFGETCWVVEKKNKHWFKVQTNICDTLGWVKAIQLILIEEALFDKYIENSGISLEIAQPIFNDEISKSIVMASSLPLFDGISCQMPYNNYVYNGQAATAQGLDFSAELLVKVARRYLYSPELTGGRSPYGIDAGAFIQNIMRCFGIKLPRQPHLQHLEGQIIDFVEMCSEGDLVFCQDNEGQINHVGMVIGEKQIIHVYGCVRIDKLDHFGIYHNEQKKYTHKLRIIKRLF
ncbi:MAG: NlpC/P60 family protein [Saprospiraceae bacterium]